MVSGENRLPIVLCGKYEMYGIARLGVLGNVEANSVAVRPFETEFALIRAHLILSPG